MIDTNGGLDCPIDGSADCFDKDRNGTQVRDMHYVISLSVYQRQSYSKSTITLWIYVVTHMYACAYLHIWKHARTYIYGSMCVLTYMEACAYLHIWKHVRTYTYVSVCVCV